MAEEKKGFFKRLFKFGKKKEEPEQIEDSSAAEAELAAEKERLVQEAKDKVAAEIKAAEEEAARQTKAAEEEKIADARRKEKEKKAAKEAERLTKEEAKAEASRIKAEKKTQKELEKKQEAERLAMQKAEEKARIEAESAEEKVKAAREAAQVAKNAEDQAAAKAAKIAQEEAEVLAKKEREAAEAAKAATVKAEAVRAEEAKKLEQERQENERLAVAEAELLAEKREIERRAEEAAEEAAELARVEAERLEEEAEQGRLAVQTAAAAEAAEQEAEAAAEEARVAQEAVVAQEKNVADTVPETDEAPTKKKSWLSRLKDGLSRSSNQLTENITAVFTKRKLDEDTLQELEDILIQADLGVETAMKITDALASQRMGKDVTDEEVREFMAGEIEKVLEPVAAELELDLDHTPHVILVVGVNGSGKTTTIGKLSQKLYDAGFSTLLVAGDTFRAAAIEQLQIWGDRTQSPVVSRPLGSDAAGLAYDAYSQALDEGRDVMLMDTAGRLQNKTELMDELEKIIRVLKKQDPTAPHTVLLTLDATTGQNALNQVEIFKDVSGVNGLVMTKLDGTARGGIMVAISAKFKLPVYFVGVGEQVDDLEPFEAREFARSIAGLHD
ncbi:MAG: signal recognition particle-docking protein FtsY [Rhizobiaceae bacterium]